MAGTGEIQRKESYHHGDLRAQLVEATRQLVEEKGPDRFSVSEACRHAGVSTAAPYRHFKDKQEMLGAVSLSFINDLTARTLDALASLPRGTHESIAAIGLGYVTHATENPGAFRLAFSMTEDHATHEDMREAGQASYNVLLDEVRRFQGKDEIDIEVRQTGFMLWTMVHGTSFLLIDEKIDVLKIELDLPVMIRTGTERILGDRPAG